jgi:hypothetical protein
MCFGNKRKVVPGVTPADVAKCKDWFIESNFNPETTPQCSINLGYIQNIEWHYPHPKSTIGTEGEGTSLSGKYYPNQVLTDPSLTNQGRCAVTNFKIPNGQTLGQVFKIYDDVDSNPDILHLGCNESQGWRVAHCSSNTNGQNAYLDIQIQYHDPVNKLGGYCAVGHPTLNEQRQGLSVVCMRYE